MSPRHAGAPGPTRVLIGAFLARFFEHESTAGRTDLRASFFWLIGALGAPGALFAFSQQFHWHYLSMTFNGEARLRAGVFADKTLYLTLTTVAMGLVSVAVWNALMIDRRDALVLGVLPVRRRAIVAAKLLSLAIYVGVLNAGTHAAAALLFGTFLGHAEGWIATGRAMAAHLVAASAVGLFVFLLVAALQSSCLAVVGPRRFARAASVLQMLLIGAIAVMLLMTPAMSRGASALATGGEPAWWWTYAPPAWFLGIYQLIAGTTSGPIHELARTGILALGGGAFGVAVFYPIACARVLASSVAATGSATHRWNRWLSSRVIDLLATDASTRGALQFVVATAGRVGRFRLVLSGAIGLGCAVIGPIVLYWIAQGVPAAPQASMLALPLLVTTTLVAGWRVVLAMPSELSAGWVFKSTPVEGFVGRAAVRRLVFVLGVAAPVAVFAPWWVTRWGLAPAWLPIANTLIAGGILVEAHLWGFVGIPCTRLLAVSDSNLQGRWPFYAIGLLVYALGIPTIEVWSSGQGAAWVLTAGLVAGYAVARRLSDDAARVKVLTDDSSGLILLDLTVVRPVIPAASIASASVKPKAYIEGPHA